MIIRGETAYVAPKEQANLRFVNLSGKRTLIGRSSGECPLLGHPRGKPFTVKLSGARTEIFSIHEGVLCPFLFDSAL